MLHEHNTLSIEQLKDILERLENIVSFSNDSNHRLKMYLPDIKTASYFPRPAASTRCFNLFRDGSTSNAGGSVVRIGVEILIFYGRNQARFM